MEGVSHDGYVQTCNRMLQNIKSVVRILELDEAPVQLSITTG